MPWSVLAVLLVSHLAVVASPAAQPEQGTRRFERVVDRELLPSSTIQALHQDRLGFLWIGTPDGLARYDGRHVDLYAGSTGGAEGLVSPNVQAIEEAPDGTLWFGTSAGLCRMVDAAAGRFSCAEDRVDVHDVRATSDAVWALTADALLRLDDGGRRLRRVRLPNTLRVGEVRRIFLRRARLHVASGALGGQHVRVASVDADGAWTVYPRPISFPAGTVGAFTPSGSPLVVAPAVPASGWSGLGALDIQPAGPGAWWVGSAHGLAHQRGATSVVVPLHGAGSLGDAVLSLLVDRDGAVWVGTRNGLYLQEPGGPQFVHRPSPSPVMAVLAGADGTVWSGSLGDGVIENRMGGSGTSFDWLRGLQRNVWALWKDGSGPLWIGTDEGLCSLALGPGCITDAFRRADGGRFVYVLEADGVGGLWAGGAALVRVDGLSGRVIRRVDLDADPAFSTLTALRRDSRGRLWVGAEKRGLWRLDSPDGNLRRVEVPGLSNGTVWSILERDDGRLWLGTSEGLRLLDPDTNTLARPAAGMPSNTVYAVLQADSLLWFTSNRGIGSLNAFRGLTRHYGRDDGTREDEFNRRALAFGSSGRILAGGVNGTLEFDPLTLGEHHAVPQAVVTGITATGPDGDSTFSAGSTLRFGPGIRALAISIAAPSPSRGRALQFRYRFGSGDPEWTSLGGEPLLRLVGLAAGAYELRASASWDGETWGREAVLSMTVLPPWYATWWFRLLAVLALGLLGFAAYRRRMSAVRRHERMRWRIASDLHDDIGSGLSSVALMTERVRDRAPLEERERRQLTSVASSSRAMVDSLREIVWFVDPAHERPGAFADRVRATAADLLGARATVRAPERLFLDTAPLSVRRDAYLFVKEALHNAARHAPKATVDIRVDVANGHLVIAVADDGPGFDASDVRRGTGLRSMERRAKSLGGDLRVESAPGEGTTVTLHAPLP